MKMRTFSNMIKFQFCFTPLKTNTNTQKGIGLEIRLFIIY